MRLSSAIILAVAAALTSSISAIPFDHNAGSCPYLCIFDSDCRGCTPEACVSISSFPGFKQRLTCMIMVPFLLSQGELILERRGALRKTSVELA
ncbi:hypothetical protein CY34DRAFT_574529 [Suillus luteus UH-Slu-Lm8-n1]|uniref:Uncharacterized protein n=1 Tax=Suillus luteus UH-Slu-Lm8-n1 TaxID=930992 RepID=A0A0D0AU55_9AGAM|nr:hypothetical protein CY34DRAFT_574529 [Suillus luteus UH-Slu-Lm8-n1]